MILDGVVKSIIDGKLMIVELLDRKQVFLPWSGAQVGAAVRIAVR